MIECSIRVFQSFQNSKWPDQNQTGWTVGSGPIHNVYLNDFSHSTQNNEILTCDDTQIIKGHNFHACSPPPPFKSMSCSKR